MKVPSLLLPARVAIISRDAIGILNSALRSAVTSDADVEAAVDAKMLAGGVG
jgi:hypothetical protein